MSDSPRGRGRGRGRGSPGDAGGRGGRGGFDGSDRGRGRGGAFRGDRGGGGGGGGSPYRGGDRGGYGHRGDRGGGGYQGGRGGGGPRGGRGGFSNAPAVWKPKSGVTPAPDANVTRLEDQLMNNQRNSLTSLTAQMGGLSVAGKGGASSDAVDFAIRPAYGSQGKPVIVTSNYFEIKSLKSIPVYQYTLEVERKLDDEARAGLKARYGSDQAPEVKGRALRSAIEAAIDKLKLTKVVATEFKSKLFSREKILSLPGDGIIEVTLAEEGGSRARTYNVRFNGPFTLRLTDLLGWTNSMRDPSDATDQAFPKFEAEIDMLGIILGHSARIDPNVVGVGKGRFFPTNIPDQMAGLSRYPVKEIIRGYFQSVRPATGRLLLNVNVAHGIFRKSGNVGQLLRDLNLNCMDTIGRDPDHLKRRYFMDLRKVAKILTKARLKVEMVEPTNNKMYVKEKTCGGFASNTDRDRKAEKPPQFQPQFTYAGPTNVKISFKPQGNTPVKFAGKPISPGEVVTIGDYWQRRYGRALDPSLPLINVGDRSRPIYVPAEGCTLIPGQALKGKLDPQEAADMIRFAVRKPAENAESITTLGRQILKLDQKDNLMTSFGLSVNPDLVTVNARVLPSPQLKYLNNKTVATEEGGWNMRGVKLMRPGRKINTWTWIYIGHERPVAPAQLQSMASIIGNFQKFMAQNMGIGFGNSRPLHQNGLSITVRQGLEQYDMLEGLRKGFGSTIPDLAIVVLPDSESSEVYNALKSAADVDIGLHTVGVVDKKIRNDRGQMQYFANVGLKVNLKFGGANHGLGNEPGIIREGKTMFVGWDVIHPTNLGADADRMPSQVGLVVSTDRNLAQWPAVFWNQKSKQEMADQQLEEAFKSRLQLWQKRNNALPEYIVIFRDGVSEGQFAQVVTHELPRIRSACRSIYGKAKLPRLTVIVSVKRHQTRFYPASDDPADRTRSNNIKNGTVVDRGVTLTRYWDFFLTAHTALQGTAKPARYTVIHDEIFISKLGPKAADEVERLTHELCYLFGRATKAVSICPPAYYADIVCTRARIHMGDVFGGSETNTTVSGQQDAAAQARDAAMARRVHPRIADDMYYI